MELTTEKKRGGANPLSTIFDWVYAGHIRSSLIAAAVEVGIPDIFKDLPMRLEDISAGLGINNDEALLRILRCLAGMGLLSQLEDKTFSCTPLLSPLRSDSDDSIVSWIKFTNLKARKCLFCDPIINSIRSGKSCCELLHDTSFFDMLQKNGNDMVLFNLAMNDMSKISNSSIISVYPFHDHEVVIDIAGGLGHLLAAILKSCSLVQGILFDVPSVIENAAVSDVWRNPSIADRCEFVAGDLFAEIPKGGDLYVLKWIIHDWGDEDAAKVLTNIRNAMHPGSKLLLIEMLYTNDHENSLSMYFDFSMMVLTGGRERSEAEYTILLENNGFRLNRVISTATPYSIIEADAVDRAEVMLDST